MYASRRAVSMVARTARSFTSTARAAIKVGDAIPDVELTENSPGNKVSIREVVGKKGIIIGVPAAFSPACSSSHIPAYINAKGLKDAGSVVVISVNDPFVMKAWGESLDAGSKSGIRFLADAHTAFIKAADLAFDSTAIFGNERSKRYALVIEDGKVKEVHVEPDNIGVDVSSAEKVLA